MGSQPPKSSSSKPSTTNNNPNPSLSPASSLSAHLAMVELRQRILTSLSKLADRDTHQIALEELQFTISTLQSDAISMPLNTLFHASSTDPKPAVRKHAVRLIAFLCAAHSQASATHLAKIVSHIAKRLRDSDSGVRDACRDAVGSLSAIYIDGAGGENGVVSLFMKPLLEALGENDKGVQIGAAMCIGNVVECAKNPPVLAFQKICSRVCKHLNSPNFFARSSLLPVISVMSQVGAIAPQSLDTLLQSINECLGSSDWATRKAAAEALSSLALHSSGLVKDGAASTLTALEACRFDKIKPVRDSIVEALQHWKKFAEKAEGTISEQKTPPRDPENTGSPSLSSRIKKKILGSSASKLMKKESSSADSSKTSGSVAERNGSISDKTVGLLKKKVPALSDKELNREFFQKLEKRGSNDVPVEFVVSRKCPTPSNKNGDYPEQNGVNNELEAENGASSIVHCRQDFDGLAREGLSDGVINGKDPRTEGAFEVENKDSEFSKADDQPEGPLVGNRGNCLAIQRQLSQLERQQTHLMNMLQGFMGGSNGSMVTLENRVLGLERVVKGMVQDLSLSSSGRRGNNFMSGFDRSSNRNMNRYKGFHDYNGKFGRGGDGRHHFSDGISPGMRGRNSSWRSEPPDSWGFHTYGASQAGPMGTSGNHFDGRSPKSEPEADQVGGYRGWEKGVGPVRLDEGPSARSVWQASKDEATLAAIRVAGDRKGTVRAARVAIPEMTAEAMDNDNNEQRDPVWIAWNNAMDAVHVGDMDSAYAEVLSVGDEFLLVKLMDRSGPVLDQLSDEMAVEVLNSTAQLVVEENLFDLCLSWIQQLVDLVMDNGPDVFGIPMEIRQGLLLNWHQATSNIEYPEDWEGPTPDHQIMFLGSAWGINLREGN